jgi:hypothetical protein
VRVDIGWAHGVVGADLIDSEVLILLDERWKTRHNRARWPVEPLKRTDYANNLSGVYM